MMELSGVFPVKTYLLKFVQKVENLEPDEPLKLTNNNGVIPITLYLFLTNKNDIIKEEYTPNKSIKENYPAMLRYEISCDMRKFNRFFFLKSSVKIFNRFLRSLMLDMLLERIQIGVKNGVTQKKVVYDFMRELEIEEDVEYETLIRAITRLKKTKNLPLIYPEIRPLGQTI